MGWPSIAELIKFAIPLNPECRHAHSSVPFLPILFPRSGFHLEERKEGPTTFALWKQMGIGVHYSKDSTYLDELDVLTCTPGLALHEHFGFSLGQYHEFFVQDLPSYMELRLGKVEVTFGEPSPLAIRIFDNSHDKHAHGDEWEAVNTVRILGTTLDLSEAYLLNAMRRYHEQYLVLPVPIQLSPMEWWEDPHEGKDPPSWAYPPITRDIEPLRCFYYGEAEHEAASAFIQFYRVIEYYVFLSLQKTIATKRADYSISDRDFLFDVARTLSRDEKGTVVRLIQQLAGPHLLDMAVKQGLSQAASGTVLANDLYDFRNSVVHAKYDQRATVVADSVIATQEKTSAWRTIARDLAARALDDFGAKDLG